MLIENYIIRGGENLSDPAIKTANFPIDAENTFNLWHTKLGQDDTEKESYFELPLDEKNRLYIKSFWLEKSGQRPVCYYVGFLIPKDTYIEAKEYYLLNNGLSKIKLGHILSAIDTLSPIPFSVEIPLPRKSLWTPFEKMSSLRLYGIDEFDKHLDEMCFSISINNIDDWFTKLFIAVNPYRINSEFNIVVSKEIPCPEMNKSLLSPSNKTTTVKTKRKPLKKTQRPVLYKKTSRKLFTKPLFFSLLLNTLLIILLSRTSYLSVKTQLRKDLETVKEELKNDLETELETELETKFVALKTVEKEDPKNYRQTIKEVSNIKADMDRLKSQNQQLQQKLIDLESQIVNLSQAIENISKDSKEK